MSKYSILYNKRLAVDCFKRFLCKSRTLLMSAFFVDKIVDDLSVVMNII